MEIKTPLMFAALFAKILKMCLKCGFYNKNQVSSLSYWICVFFLRLLPKLIFHLFSYWRTNYHSKLFFLWNFKLFNRKNHFDRTLIFHLLNKKRKKLCPYNTHGKNTLLIWKTSFLTSTKVSSSGSGFKTPLYVSTHDAGSANGLS